MTRILHVVTDYPDGVNKVYTKAVKNLLEVTKGELSHHVISIVRKSGFKFDVIRQSDNLIVLVVPKVKLAIPNLLIMRLAYSKLVHALGHDYFKNFDFIHAHKLTIDGVLGWVIAKLNQRKLVVSVRGSTDVKWVNGDIIGRHIYRKVFNYSTHNFWISAWAKKVIIKMLKINNENLSDTLLPNICREDFNNKIVVNHSTKKFVFVGRLDSKDSKGLLKVIKAVSAISNAKMDVYGSFSAEQLTYLDSYILGFNAKDRVSVLGRINNDELKIKLPEYAALLMPSNPETFGISYVEALAKNIPILGSKFSGISGYLENKSYIALVDEKKEQEISACINTFLVKQQQIKNELYNDISEGVLDFLSDEGIKKHYVKQSQRIAINAH